MLKKQFILLLSFLMVNVLLAFGQAKFSVDHSTHKFPKSKQNVMLEHTFKVTNDGDQPLIISEFKVACPCTKVILPKAPIAPGESIDLKVTFDTTGKSYFQDRTIYLTTNTKKGSEKLRIKVMVEP